MKVIPAIDLRGGKCVRLYQGDYGRQTVFDDDPVAVALRWRSQGATWVHIVDLDGAAEGRPVNADIVRRIVAESGLQVELGGGIRREDTAEGWLAEGVSRIVLGTVAVEAPELVAALCARHGEAIVVSLDARAGRIAVDGWRKDTPVDAVELAHRMVEMGVRRLIHTDIERDGTLSEPQLDSIARLLAEVKVPVVAAGGISTVEHLGLLEKLGVEGAIIGRALYTGDIDLGEAVMRFGG